MMTPEEKRAANRLAVREYRKRTRDPELKAQFQAEKAAASAAAPSNQPEWNRNYQRDWARKQRAERTPEEKAANLEYRRQWHEKNKERVQAQKRARREKPEVKAQESAYGKKRRQADPEKFKEEIKEWRSKNKKRLADYARSRHHVRKVHDKKYAAVKNLRSRMYSAFSVKGLAKKSQTWTLLQCSREEFITYMESKFRHGMSWMNYGRGGWVIDHILPCESFDLLLEDEVMKCFHYTNLQPLWEKENREKWDKLPCGTRARMKKPASP